MEKVHKCNHSGACRWQVSCSSPELDVKLLDFTIIVALELQISLSLDEGLNIFTLLYLVCKLIIEFCMRVPIDSGSCWISL